jgi:hypothetical protein
MSLLNRPSDGMHSVLIAVNNLLAQEGALPLQQIIELCAPESCGDPSQVRQTINTWVKLGLFGKSEDDKISFSKSISKSEKAREALPRVARRLVLSPENNANLWAAESVGSADFTRSVAWLLAQDVYRAELNSWGDAQVLIQKQVNKNVTIIQNDTRWSGLKAWSQFLGFAWSGKFPGGALVIDPTEAVADALPEIFKKRSKITAEQLVGELAQIIPVLDSGAYRNEVESKMIEHGGWHPQPEGCVSTSLSRSILRLIHEGILVGENLSDAGSRLRLIGRVQKEIETFSHITFAGKP